MAYGILIAPNINPDISLELDLFKGKDAAAEIHARRISRSSVRLFCWRLWEWVTSSNFLIWLLTHLAILHLIVWLVFVCHWEPYMMTSSAQCDDIEQLLIAAVSLGSVMTIAFLSHYVLQMWPWIVNVHTIKMVPRGLEPRTLRLLAVRSNQLSYETHDVDRRYQVLQLLALSWCSNEDLMRRKNAV